GGGRTSPDANTVSRFPSLSSIECDRAFGLRREGGRMTGDQTAPQTLTTAVDPVELAQKIPQLAERQIVQGTVVRVDTEGGLVVDLGMRGFVPGSHVDLSQAKGRRFEWFVGQSIPLKVLEVDRPKGRVILSHRLAVEEERQKRKGELLATLQEGMAVEGTV